jgi:hypothetical protein
MGGNEPVWIAECRLQYRMSYIQIRCLKPAQEFPIGPRPSHPVDPNNVKGEHLAQPERGVWEQGQEPCKRCLIAILHY